MLHILIIVLHLGIIRPAMFLRGFRLPFFSRIQHIRNMLHSMYRVKVEEKAASTSAPAARAHSSPYQKIRMFPTFRSVSSCLIPIYNSVTSADE